MAIERGVGFTTHQLMNAPRDALYIISANASVPYFRGLASRLQRTDLTIARPDIMSRIKGRTFTQVVLDHTTVLTSEQRQQWRDWRVAKRISALLAEPIN